MDCKPNLERHGRVVAALTLTLGVNGPFNLYSCLEIYQSGWKTDNNVQSDINSI